MGEDNVQDGRVLNLDGQRLLLSQVVEVARSNGKARPRVCLAEAARRKLDDVRRVIDQEWLAGAQTPIYGFNTGVGGLKGRSVPPERIEEFQRHYIRSHCVGVGPNLPDEVVTAAILVRANSLAAGFSGVRPALIDGLLELINRGIVPQVPLWGSLGASGDLAPLAHVGSVLIGEPGASVAFPGGGGTVEDLIRAMPDWKPLVLQAKEAMALTNGTSFMLAMAVLLLADARRILRTADLTAALSLEAMQGEVDAFDGRLQALRPHPGQQASAANVRDLIEGSRLLGIHRAGPPRVQDAYSLRCVPQVHGASRDAISFLEDTAFRELNAVTDNPLVFPEGEGYRALSGGNFHGQPLALAMDFAGLALAEIGSIAERRVFRILESNLSYGLPPNLTGGEPGVNTGYMLVQYTAAALVSENKTLVHPSAADSIPTSGDQEDHVSMGMHAGAKARRIAENVERILGIECLCACQGISLIARNWGGDPPTGRGTGAAYRAFRDAGILELGEDRYLQPEIQRSFELVRSGELLRRIQETTQVSLRD